MVDLGLPLRWWWLRQVIGVEAERKAAAANAAAPSPTPEPELAPPPSQDVLDIVLEQTCRLDELAAKKTKAIQCLGQAASRLEQAGAHVHRHANREDEIRALEALEEDYRRAQQTVEQLAKTSIRPPDAKPRSSCSTSIAVSTPNLSTARTPGPRSLTTPPFTQTAASRSPSETPPSHCRDDSAASSDPHL